MSALEIAPSQATVVLRIDGDLDDVAGARLRRRFDTLAGRDVRLDVAHGTDLSQAALGALAAGIRHVQRSGGTVRLDRCPDDVAALFRATIVADLFDR